MYSGELRQPLSEGEIWDIQINKYIYIFIYNSLHTHIEINIYIYIHICIYIRIWHFEHIQNMKLTPTHSFAISCNQSFQMARYTQQWFGSALSRWFPFKLDSDFHFLITQWQNLGISWWRHADAAIYQYIYILPSIYPVPTLPSQFCRGCKWLSKTIPYIPLPVLLSSDVFIYDWSQKHC